MGCDHSYSLLFHMHTSLKDTVLICPSGPLKKEESSPSFSNLQSQINTVDMSKVYILSSKGSFFSVCSQHRNTKTIPMPKPSERKCVLKFILQRSRHGLRVKRSDPAWCKHDLKPSAGELWLVRTENVN